MPFVLSFFLIGIGWGVWSRHQLKSEMAKATPLRVLCGENWISEAVLQKFSREHNIPVQLWTYSRPSEFLRQMANSDGKVDVICTSSLLLKSLVQSHWIKKTSFEDLLNMQLVSVDFRHLPFDTHAEYSVPLFWNVYGMFGKRGAEAKVPLKKVWQTKRVTLWGEELNLLYVMSVLGVNVEERLEREETKGLEEDIQAFTSRAAQILPPDNLPIAADNLLEKTDWILLPLARVARLLGDDTPYQFWLPEDGAPVEIGLLSIGEKAQQPEKAKALIGDLLATDHALEVHQRLGTGVVHSTLSNMNSVAPLQRAEALRQFPLNKLKFPDLSVEALPRFQKIYDEKIALKR